MKKPKYTFTHTYSKFKESISHHFKIFKTGKLIAGGDWIKIPLNNTESKETTVLKRIKKIISMDKFAYKNKNINC